MCIALITTAHPDYPFILLNNRDEFLTRPTAHAEYWPSPNDQVLGGRDLQRPEQGTWLGITTQGRLACLTNFRESGAQIYGSKSRGGLPKGFLTLPPDSEQTPEEWAKYMVDEFGVNDVGGFSLVFGRLSRSNLDGGKGLAIISNRTDDANSMTWICGKQGETHGLSNSHFGDRSWPKVFEGEKALNSVIEAHVSAKSTKNELIAQLFDILSTDTLPRRKHGEDWDTYISQLRNSIFIPRIGGEELEDSSADEIAAASLKRTAKTSTTKADGGLYGTQKQTVVLVDHNGGVTFVEKTLYDEDGHPLHNDDTVEYEFDIAGWDN